MEREVDVDADLERRGCAREFEALQVCMADSDRDWGKCQERVKEWKKCNEIEKDKQKQRH